MQFNPYFQEIKIVFASEKKRKKKEKPKQIQKVNRTNCAAQYHIADNIDSYAALAPPSKRMCASLHGIHSSILVQPGRCDACLRQLVNVETASALQLFFIRVRLLRHLAGNTQTFNYYKQVIYIQRCTWTFKDH